ncbi:MAG: hypothetical protein HKN22_07155 [Bacteroidia bacterium]|nr:hypothetical protein [Bacteroidia bacterium]
MKVELVVKVGGAVITDKSAPAFFNSKQAEKLASEFLPFIDQKMVIIHGTGMIGKPPAVKYGFHRTGVIAKEGQATALKIKKDILGLNDRFIQVMNRASIPTIRFDISRYYDSVVDDFNQQLIKDNCFKTFKENKLPVLHGDMIRLADDSHQVISSDLITAILARILRPRYVIFLTNVDGVYLNKREMQKGNYMRSITSKELNEMEFLGSDELDVSGGMRSKLKYAIEASKYCERCFIGNGKKVGILNEMLLNAKGTQVSIEDQ